MTSAALIDFYQLEPHPEEDILKEPIPQKLY
jgi:hypothetical protein